MNLEDLLTDEDRQIRETVRNFTKKEIIPNTRKLEADYKLVEEVHQKLVDIGIQAAGYPAEYGGGNGSNTALGIICEELAKGDGGISLSAGINWGIILKPAIVVQNKALMDRFIPSFCSGKLAYACLSMTDEAGGADSENP
ncbi:MAG: acyl-CoA dehydrogenase family protein, partial [Dehalococcoidales bacterium]|nr:acyl-CoA dehydrogenase family protein [Dehalococcoidales bacterium]